MLRLHKWLLSPDEAPRKFLSAVEAARRAKTCGNLIFHACGNVVICQPAACYVEQMSRCLLPHPVVYGFLSGWNYRRFFKIRPALYLRLPIIRRVSMAPGYDGIGSAHGANPVTNAIPQLLA